MNEEFNQNNDDMSTENNSGSSTATHNEEVAICRSERDAWKERYVRAAADLDNYTKRMEKERLQWRNTVQGALLLDILPIVDDFDRAFEAAPKGTDLQSQLAGFEMIRKSLQKLLDKYEVKEISGSLPFDPEFHEALVQVDSPDHTSGSVVAVLQKGYTFRDTVLRPAKVSVAK